MSADPNPPASPEELARVEALLEEWLQRQLSENPTVVAVDRDTASAERLWMMRLAGDDKAHSTVWFHLRQRTLTAETHFMPAPLEGHAEVWSYLLRLNHGLHGAAFTIGGEDAVYLVARLPVAWVSDAELDRLLGTFWATVERSFRAAMRLGYGDRFTG